MMSANLHEAQTIEQFLTRYPVSMSLVEVPENPTMENSLNSMINYHVTLEYEKRTMLLYFSTGLGWVEKRFVSKKGAGPAPGVSYDKKHKRFIKTEWSGKKYDADANVSTFSRYRIRKPVVADVLDCLASDANGINQSFEEWASDLGYDTDSRKAERTYQTCQKQARELRQLLGAAAFEELLYRTERM